MTDLDRIRLALDSLEQGYSLGVPMPNLQLIKDAARRYVLLAETSPDYEAATREFADLTDIRVPSVAREATKRIVDAAVSKWLTDLGEETE